MWDTVLYVAEEDKLYSERSLTEAELIERIVAGEKLLFRHLVEQHKEMIFSVLMRQCGDRELAQDLTQEAFLKAYTNLRSFRSASRFSTWLTRIALNQMSNHFASRRYKEARKTESFDMDRHDSATDSHDELHAKERRLAGFRSCLAKLQHKFREVIVLAALEERSYEETAQLVGIPVGTVRSRLNKARLLLKDCLLRSMQGEGETV